MYPKAYHDRNTPRRAMPSYTPLIRGEESTADRLAAVLFASYTPLIRGVGGLSS